MNIFELFGKIAINNTGANQAIDQTGKKANTLASTVGKAFDKVGKFAVNCGKVMAKGLAVGTAAMTGLVVKGMGLAGELEQNMGGSEAVFKQFAESMQKTAQEAYRNMGLSQSDYLATANKMGALFQGVGYSIEDSASITEKAMQRASDVASIMGIDVSTAMESIAGAAKGNFTMMDNLGVAINDTTLKNYALEKGIKKSTAQMSTQEKVALAMELFMEKTAYAAGNYAKENDTLAGSLNTAKAAFKNFLSGAGDAKALASSLTNTGKVITKNLKKLLPHLVEGISELLNSLMPELPALLESLLPGVIDGAGNLLGGIAKALPSLAKVVVDKIPEILRNLAGALNTALPQLTYAILGMFRDLPSKLPEILREVGNVINTVWGQGIWPGIQSLFKAVFKVQLPKWAIVKLELRKQWDESGIGPYFEEKFGNIKTFVEDVSGAIGKLFSFDIPGIDMENGLLAKIGEVTTKIGELGIAITSPVLGIILNWNAVKTAVTDAIDAIGNFFTQTIPQAWKDMITSVETWWNDHIVMPIQNGINAVSTFFGQTIPQAWKDMCSAVGAWWNDHITAPILAAIEALETFLGLEGKEGEHVPGITGTGGNSAGFARSQFQGKGNKQPVVGGNDSTNYVPGHADGLDFVPFDNYLARLHYGEMVLTRKDADAWRKGSTGNMALLSAKFDQMQETFLQVLEGIRNQPIAVNIDSKTAAVLMAREMTKSIGNRNIQSLMGMGG